MARGDAFVTLVYFSSIGTVDVQPASGVEIMITFIAGDGTGIRIRAKKSDGTTTSDLYFGRTGGETSDSASNDIAYLGIRVPKIFITNSVFIQLYSSAPAKYVFISGMQTK